MKTIIAFLLLTIPAIAEDGMPAPSPFYTTDKLSISSMVTEPPSLFYIGNDGKKVFTIHPDGKVEVNPDVPMDEVARDFWKGIEASGFQCHADR